MPSTTPGFRCLIRVWFEKKHTPKLSSPSFCFPEWSVTQQRSSGFAFILNPISSQTRQFAVGLWPCLQPSDQLPCQRWKINRMWYYTECVKKKIRFATARVYTSQKFAASQRSQRLAKLFAAAAKQNRSFRVQEMPMWHQDTKTSWLVHQFIHKITDFFMAFSSNPGICQTVDDLQFECSPGFAVYSPGRGFREQKNIKSWSVHS